MTITARHALVTGGSRGIGRGIALKLAEQGVHIAINYLRDEASAKATLEQVRARGSDGFTVQADVSQPADVDRLFDRVGKEFGSLDIFVANARGEVGTFYESAMTITLDKWDAAMDSQARAFLVAVQKGEKLLTTADASSPFRTRPAGSLAAGSRGWPWAPPSLRSRCCAGTSPWRWHRAASPSTRSAPAGPTIAS
jgi:NAD(P)-dependent dehydrogenase (short-subunit alcohol dehydrogenase family)